MANGEAEDTRCDIYAFGAVLYELLTGQPPYMGRMPQAILDQVLKGPPPSIRSVNPRANPALVRIAETCMARQLRDRYATMDDVAADLHRAARGAKPLGRHLRRRRRYLRALAAAGALAAAAGLAVLAFQRVAAGRQRPAVGPGIAAQTPPPSEPVGPVAPSETAAPSAYIKSLTASFAQAKRQQMYAAAAAAKLGVHPQFNRLFDAIEKGDAEAVSAAWHWISRRVGQYEQRPGDPEIDPSLHRITWQYILDAYGAWGEFSLWSPELVRMYGDDITASILPDAVFFGGTDPGRFVTTAFNEISRKNWFMVITQNGLADNSYMDYVRRCHGARLSLPAEADVSGAYRTFTNDVACGRQPPGVEITVKDGKIAVTGAQGVMAIKGDCCSRERHQHREGVLRQLPRSYGAPVRGGRPRCPAARSVAPESVRRERERDRVLSARESGLGRQVRRASDGRLGHIRRKRRGSKADRRVQPQRHGHSRRTAGSRFREGKHN